MRHSPLTTERVPPAAAARPRALRRALLRVAAIAALALPGAEAGAQIPIPFPTARPGQPADTSARADTMKVPAFRHPPPVAPLGVLWRSLLFPGWGQSVVGRRVTGAVFVAWEGVTLTMTLKALHQLRYLERTGSNNVASKRQEVQDWAILWGFNHLLAGAEAFVSANLWDFPTDLEARSLPQGRVGIGLAVAIGAVPR